MEEAERIKELEDLYSKYYLITNSLGEEVVVDRKTKEMIKSTELMGKLRASNLHERKKEFEELKSVYNKYFVAFTSDLNEVAVDKETLIVSPNQELINKIKFSKAWVESKGLSLGIPTTDYTKIDDSHRYQLAFRMDEFLLYSGLMTSVQKELRINGNIDVCEIYNNAIKLRNIIGKEMYDHLFESPEYVKALDSYARYLTPEALEPTKDLTTLSGKKVNSVSHKLN